MTSRNKRPPGTNSAGSSEKRPPADPRAEPETVRPTTMPSTDRFEAPPPARLTLREMRAAASANSAITERPTTGNAAIHKQLAALQLQVAEGQRQMAQHQEERAADTDRLAEMLKRLSRTELRARAAEASLAARASEGEQRAVPDPAYLEKLAEKEKQSDERLQKIEELEARLALSAAERQGSLQSKDEELAGLRRDLVEAREIGDAKGKQVEVLVIEVDGLQTAEQELTKTIDALRASEKELSKAVKGHAEKAERLATLRSEVETLRESADQVASANVQLEEDLEAARNEHVRVTEALKRELTKVTAQRDAQSKTHLELRSKEDGSKRELEARDKELTASKAKLEEEERSLAALRAGSLRPRKLRTMSGRSP